MTDISYPLTPPIVPPVFPGCFADDVVRVMDTATEVKAGTDGRVSFEEFLDLLEQAGPAGPLEGPDPKVQQR